MTMVLVVHAVALVSIWTEYDVQLLWEQGKGGI